MEQSRLLKTSWVLYTIFLVGALVLSAANIARPMRFYVGDVYEAYVGESWDTLVAQEPKKANLYENFSRYGAAWVSSATLLALFITLAAYRHGQRWAWIALLAGLLAGQVVSLSLSSRIGGLAGTPHDVSWLCVGLVILLLPVKEMLGVKTSPAKPRPAGALGEAKA